MTDDEKLSKLEETEQRAWGGNWMKWTPSGWEREVSEHLDIIERCQRIRAYIEAQNPREGTASEKLTMSTPEGDGHH